MTTDSPSNDLQRLWQRQGTEEFRMTPQQIHTRIEDLGRRARRRNRGGYVVGALVILTCVWWAIQFDNATQRTGTLLTLVGIGRLVVELRANQRGTHEARRGMAMGETASLAFLRAELERQRGFHWGRPFLARLLVLIPGPLLFLAGFAQAHPEIAGSIAAQAVFFLLLVVVAVPLNRWLARGYQRQLDALAQMQGEQ
jgi:hypothetical protein